MTGRIEKRLVEIGLVLPQATAPAANYVPFVLSGDLVFLAGQLPFQDGKLAQTGLLGRDVGLEDGVRAARLCAINLITQIKAALEGDLDRVRRIVRVGGFVASTADFIDQPKVVNGASDLFVEVFGDIGRHARSAVSAPSLPLGAAVEVEAIIQISL
ncbi:hypothetical protein FACS1894205_5810 [Alphaproteobacteria bacterium]|nr:hypothetical protein FACS1894205_5810 [Alphaproteobacteria bacterium]